MTKRVQEYLINVWNLWIGQQPQIWVWFHAFRSMVQTACRCCKEGWTDEQVIRTIRYTCEDETTAVECNDPAGGFYTE